MERDSIVFYKDWWEAIKQLPEDKQMAAIKAVMDYAFTGAEPTDAMLRFATAQIRMFIDRDQKRYEEICEKRKAAIKKRWEKEKQKNTNDTKEYNCIQPNTTLYHNENENENENENDTIEINFNGGVDKTRMRETSAYDDSGLLAEFFAPEKQATLETLAMQLHLTFDEMKQMATEVVSEWTLTRQRHPTYNDASRHLISTLRKKKQWGQQQKGRQSSGAGLGIGEWRDDKGRRRYERSDVIVPEDAPLRPSAAHWWSETSRQWEKQL